MIKISTIILVFFLFGLLALTLLNLPFRITGKTIEIKTFTKAICNSENYCEDYLIQCQENKPINITPTGLSIQQNKNWKDPREQKELCE